MADIALTRTLEGVAHQARKLAVVAGIGGLQASAHQFQAVIAVEDVARHRVELQHTAALIEDNGGHRQAADGLKIQTAQRLAAVQLRMQVQGPTQVRQQHGAQRPLTVAELGLIAAAIDTNPQLAAIGHADIGAKHLKAAIGLAVQQVERRAQPLGFRHQVINGEDLVQRQIIEGGRLAVIGVMLDFPGTVDFAYRQHRRQVRLIHRTQDQGDDIGLEQPL
ncbi:hypothetical protein D3C77_111510 [compost metagenome]